MPFIEVEEPHARPPRLPAPRQAQRWGGVLELDRGWAELDGVEVRGAAIDVAECAELAIVDSTISGVGLAEPNGPRIEIRSSVLDGCDLSQAEIGLLNRTRLEGCKLTGTDLSGAAITDVEIERCSFRFANLRMARLNRVRFVDCSFHDVDGFQLEASDVSFDGCSMSGLNIDRLTATRVDLRGATELGLTGIGRLDGCLIGDHQLPALAPMLALAIGLDLER